MHTFKYELVLHIIYLYMLETSLSVYLVSAVDQLCRLRCDNMIIKQEIILTPFPLSSLIGYSIQYSGLGESL